MLGERSRRGASPNGPCRHFRFVGHKARDAGGKRREETLGTMANSPFSADLPLQTPPSSHSQPEMLHARSHNHPNLADLISYPVPFF